MKTSSAFTIILITLIGLTASACVATKSARQQTANRIAGPAFMVERQLQAGPFALTLFERIHDRGGPAHVYIEGENNDASKNPLHNPQQNPLHEKFFVATPENPLALRLASYDKAQNVIYIARPCQYSNRFNKWKQVAGENETCDTKFITTDRFAPEVISSYNAALDEIKQRWGIRSFDLYGHAGGGAIAAILASQRSDITTLTTVAGNLDTAAYNDLMIRTAPQTFQPLSNSTLNPKMIARDIADIPQYHYAGGADEQIPPSSLHGFLAAMGPGNCAQYKIIHENTNREGWVEKWPDILKDKPTCQGVSSPITTTPDDWR
jgi:hypothetical protein